MHLSDLGIVHGQPQRDKCKDDTENDIRVQAIVGLTVNGPTCTGYNGPDSKGYTGTRGCQTGGERTEVQGVQWTQV